MSAFDSINAKLGRLRFEMDHGNKSLRWLAPIRGVLKKMGVGDYLRRKNDKYVEAPESFQAFCDQHREELDKVYEMLEDDFSRTTWEKLLQYRKTLDVGQLKGVKVMPQYFQKDIFGPVEDEVFVDGGAYIGDTVESFLKEFTGGVQKDLCLGAG